MNIIKDKKCVLCSDKIGLYTPYYTVRTRGWLCRTSEKHNNPMTLCTHCYHAYESLITQMEIQNKHQQNYLDMKGEKRL